jgi:methyl-accepting chemotaxis protein
MMMLEALERQDSAVLGMLLGKSASKELLDKSEKSFREGLEKARSHMHIPAEGKVVVQITDRFETYCEGRDRLLARTQEHPLVAYDEETFPRFEDVKESVLTLLDINHQAMLAADRKAQQTANLRAVLHGLLVAIALLSLGFLSREMRRNVLDRMEELKSVAQAIASGDRSRRAAVREADELGLVARQLNAILDRELQVEGSTAARLIEQRQLILGLLRCYDYPVALVALTGDVVASTLAEGDEKILQEILPRILPEFGRGHLDSQNVDAGAHRIRLVPVDTQEKRLVGWLITLTSKGARLNRASS